MRLRLLPIVGLLLIACLGAGTAVAQPRGHTIGQEEFASLFRDLLRQGTPWPATDLEVRRLEAQPATLAVSSSDYSVVVLERASAVRLGKNALTVAILVDGKEEGRVRLHGDLLLYGPVLCATRKLERHHQLHAGDLGTVRREIGNLDPAVLRRPEEAIGKQLKSSLQPGAILYPELLESPTLVKRGDRVTIMASNGAIRVTVPGQARDNGAAGELVRVKNLMSRKEITARVIDSGVVETEL
jgi:flagella basal body P-ring formation protein FlgA